MNDPSKIPDPTLCGTNEISRNTFHTDLMRDLAEISALRNEWRRASEPFSRLRSLSCPKNIKSITSLLKCEDFDSPKLPIWRSVSQPSYGIPADSLIDTSASTCFCKNPFTMGIYAGKGTSAPHDARAGKWLSPSQPVREQFSTAPRMAWTQDWNISTRKRSDPHVVRAASLRTRSKTS